MSKGVFTFEGGTDRLIKLMHEELIKSGVDVRIKCDVQKILVRDGRVSGVQVNGGARSRAGARGFQRESQGEPFSPGGPRALRSEISRGCRGGSP